MRRLKEIITENVVALWDKTTTSSALYVSEKVFFFILSFLEHFYRLGFFFIKKAKPILFPPYQAPCKVIAVGNLSVGGTGKSVLVNFLVNNLTWLRCAVLSRGYKRSKEYQHQSLLVSDGKNIFYSTDACGDEAVMLAKKLSVPVLVGANRVQSLQILMNTMKHNEQAIDLVILDDAYQNQQLIKDFQILLLDARKPFENEHCLPAGRLREKDYSRADLIILTHADRVPVVQLHDIKNKLAEKKQIPVFFGMHRNAGIFRNNEEYLGTHAFIDKSMMAVAGIGSFLSFVQSLEQLSLSVSQKIEFQDHHCYTVHDVQLIVEQAIKNKCHGIVTTEKDWCKLKQIYRQASGADSIVWYVMRVEFEFLSPAEYHSFMKVIKEKLS